RSITHADIWSRSTMWSRTLFFYCSGAHPVLHSFPTRRSSDLALLDQRKFGGAAADIDVEQCRIVAARQRHRARAVRRELAFHVVDRKSTRLNSSHVEISYAVFCLKKKKK